MLEKLIHEKPKLLNGFLLASVIVLAALIAFKLAYD
jgi:hypothetical protein